MTLHAVSNHSAYGFLFAFLDGLVIVGSVAACDFFLWGGQGTLLFITENLQYKVMAFVLVIQILFYYFDLYETKSFHQREHMILQMFEALLFSAIGLSIFYYFLPSLGVGRRIFLLSFLLIFLLTSSLRFLFPLITKNGLFRERILIVGNGAWAHKIAEDIRTNSPDSFEIVGFVDEKREEAREAS
jgi:FlaA1/EpsC-like NDP-sugar epimerase